MANLKNLKVAASALFSSGFIVKSVKIFAGRAAGLPLSFLANLLIGRLLGPEKYGSYMEYLSIALVASSFTVFGSDKIIVREIAYQPSNYQGRALKTLLKWVIKSHSQIYGLLVVAALIWIGYNYVKTPQAVPLILASLSMVPFYAVTILACAVLVGSNCVGVAQSLDNIVKNFVLLLGCSVFYFFHLKNLELVLLLQSGSFVVSTLYGVVYITLCVKPAWKFDGGIVEHSVSQDLWKKSSLTFFVGGAAIILMSRLDVILVNLVGTPIEAGLFGAANRLAQLGSIIPLVVLYMLQPIFARSSQLAFPELLREMRRGRLISFWMTVLFLAPAMLLAPWILAAMGPGFSQAALSLRIILLGYLATSAAMPDYAYLTMTGGERGLARVNWTQLIVTVVATFLLVPRLGATGGAIAYLTGATMTALCNHILARRSLALRARLSLGSVSPTSGQILSTNPAEEEGAFSCE